MNQFHKKGFTLIELMLAMTFISFLLIAIAMTVIQISNIYNRGLTLKEVNQAGRALTTELQRSVAASSLFSLDPSVPENKFIQKDWGGRLCVGQYSYIWNYGKTLKATGTTVANSNVYNGSSNKIRFIKVSDPTGTYCVAPANGAISTTRAVELLNVGDLELAVHNFTISNNVDARDDKTYQGLYSISFAIGTNDQTTLVPSGTALTCRPPSDTASDLTYCSVNQFDIVARTGNAVQ